MSTVQKHATHTCDELAPLFEMHADATSRNAAKHDGWSSALWQTLLDARLVAPRALGAAVHAGSTPGLVALLRSAGRFGVSLPIAETAIAAWMLERSGLAVPDGPLALAPTQHEMISAQRRGGQWLLSGRLTRVPWASRLGHMAVLAAGPGGDIVACVETARCAIGPRHNLAGEARDDVMLENIEVSPACMAPAGEGVNAEAIRLHGALMRSVQIAGALERALDLSVAHAREREQFGRKIAQFQAIQHELARFAGEVAVAVAAALSAAGATARAGNILAARWAVAAAKLRAAQAAGEGAMIAHQVHGAIGITDEHPLHHVTLRLWAWREEYGNEAYWAEVLGNAVLAEGADAFWPSLTGGQN